MSKEKIALIPAYEPTDILVTLAENISNKGIIPIIVDDGSGKDYADIFSRASEFAVVLKHKCNCGKGTALKTGLEYIKNKYSPESTVVTVDSDGQHRIEDMNNVLEKAEYSNNCLILGSRCFDGDVPLRSRFGNTVTRMIFRLSSGVYVRDTQTGLRAFRADMIPFLLSIEGSRYEYEMNMLLECAKRKIPIIEMDIQTVYFDNNSGSHFSTLRDSARIYANIIKFTLSSLLGFVVDYVMYSILSLATGGLGTAISVPLSNISARVISSGVNYSVNKHVVFKDKGNAFKTAFMYFFLAACILAGNTLILSLMVGKLGINRYFAKIVTEIIFFTLSWIVQRHIIFRKVTEKI